MLDIKIYKSFSYSFNKLFNEQRDDLYFFILKLRSKIHYFKYNISKTLFLTAQQTNVIMLKINV